VGEKCLREKLNLTKKIIKGQEKDPSSDAVLIQNDLQNFVFLALFWTFILLPVFFSFGLAPLVFWFRWLQTVILILAEWQRLTGV
jgi:hypothetical protein